MSTPRVESATTYRWGYIWGGGILSAVGAVLLAISLTRHDVLPAVVGDLALGLFGWGPPLLLLKGPALALQLMIAGMPKMGLQSWQLAAAGGALWLVGWVAIALGIRRAPTVDEAPSEAVGAAPYPPLARYRDFYWGTLGAYGGGILGAELVLIFLQTALAGGLRVGAGAEPGSGAKAANAALLQMPPTVAFIIALAVACAVAFGAGFIGAARSRRLSAPEATIGFIYFGLPIPLFLTLLAFVPQLQLSFAYSLREVIYLASLLGRAAEAGYWLIFALLALMMVLGITSGFVATGSGRVDLRTGFELFVARRHVSVFRPRFLLGLLGVLMLGIIPPLIVYAMVRAAQEAVERTRIRALGVADPLKATAALNSWKTREQTPTEMMTALSVGGVGVGVMALIIVLSVMSGFEVDLQKKILGSNAHVIVLKYGDSFPEYHDAMEKIRQVPGVVGMTPFVMNEVMISSEGNISGSLIHGIDPATIGDVLDLPQNILPGGSLDYLTHPEKITASLDPESALRDAEAAGGKGKLDERGAPREEEPDPIIKGLDKAKKPAVLPGIVLGRELAASLKVVVGDQVNVVSPVGGELGPQGPMPKSRSFRVAGIFYSGMYEYDSKFVYIRIDEAADFFKVQGATGIELKVADMDDARRIAKLVLEKLDGYPYRTRDWGEMNKNLFSALRLEKLVMAIILSLIVVVAAGLIVATVIMLVLEKRKEISVLKALGVPDGGIVKIFLAEGLQIGIAGGLLGLFSGLAWCLFIEKVGIKLDPEVYYIPSLPVKIEPFQTALAVLIAILVTYLGSIYPALKASRVEPVEGLKAE